MARTFDSSNLNFLTFGSEQFDAFFDLPNVSSPAEIDQLPQDAIVQELRDALYSVTQEMKFLRKDNKQLKEKIVLLEDDQRQEVSQLQELKKKKKLLERVTKKLMACTKANVEISNLLTQKEEELKSIYDALKASLDQMAQKAKMWKRKLQEVQKKKGSRHKKPFEKVQRSRPKKGQTTEDTERIISESNQPQKRGYKQKLKKNRKRAKRENIRMEEMEKDVTMMTT